MGRVAEVDLYLLLDTAGATVQPFGEAGATLVTAAPEDQPTAGSAEQLEAEAKPEAEQLTERPAEPGELCTCGRQAIVVYLGSVFGPTGYCGIPDRGDQTGPCPFCGGPRHEEPYGRCPHYRLRLDAP
jgi:hypothetical protein